MSHRESPPESDSPRGWIFWDADSDAPIWALGAAVAAMVLVIAFLLRQGAGAMAQSLWGG